MIFLFTVSKTEPTEDFSTNNIFVSVGFQKESGN